MSPGKRLATQDTIAGVLNVQSFTVGEDRISKNVFFPFTFIQQQPYGLVLNFDSMRGKKIHMKNRGN